MLIPPRSRRYRARIPEHLTAQLSKFSDAVALIGIWLAWGMMRAPWIRRECYQTLSHRKLPRIEQLLAMLHQRRSDWMVNIAHFQIFIG